MNPSQSLPPIPPRHPDSHKGDYGHGLLIGGSRGMAGAIAIAAQAALRSGMGLTTVATPDACADLVASFHPGFMTLPLPCDQEGKFTVDAFDRICSTSNRWSAVAVGPGMGWSTDIASLVGSLYATLPVPMVLDADALNSLSQSQRWPEPALAPRILTPHPGEFQRMSAVSSKDREKQIAAAEVFAREYQVTIVLKGHRSWIIGPEAKVCNETGTPAMAVGGSGDCLTGIILALLCQKFEPFAAAQLGAHVHGLAGQIAHERIGGLSVLATDIIEALPEAFSKTIAGNS